MTVTFIEIIFNMAFSQEVTVLILLFWQKKKNAQDFLCIHKQNLFKFNTYL